MSDNVCLAKVNGPVITDRTGFDVTVRANSYSLFRIFDFILGFDTMVGRQ